MAWQVDKCDAYVNWLRKLSGKFPSSGDDIDNEFSAGPPNPRWPLPGFNKKLWKTRVGSTDLGKGKSHSFRVIFYWDETVPNWCCLGACYFKGEMEDMSAKELKRLYNRLWYVVGMPLGQGSVARIL